MYFGELLPESNNEKVSPTPRRFEMRHLQSSKKMEHSVYEYSVKVR